MKYKFEPRQLEYMNAGMTLVRSAIWGKKVDEKLARLVSKLKYKFTPNASIVYMTQTERAFMLDLFNMRLADLVKRSVIGEEVDLVQQLIERLEQ